MLLTVSSELKTNTFIHVDNPQTSSCFY